jgi:hypothetical protein
MKRSLLYVAIFSAIMAVAVSIPVWRELDCWIYALLNRGPSIPVSQDLVLVDVPYPDSKSLKTFRQRVTGLLNTIAGKPKALLPKLVVLDISIAAEKEGLAELLEAVEKLQAAKVHNKVHVYAAVDPRDKGRMDQHDPEYMAQHAKDLYSLLDGKGHTKFHHYKDDLVWYDPLIEIPVKVKKETMGSDTLPALPLLIAAKDFQVLETDTAGSPVIVKMGNLGDLRKQTFTFHAGDGKPPSFTHYQPPDGTGAASPADPDFENKLVIVASLNEERHGVGDLSRPEVLAFAISERILHGNSGKRPELLANTGLLIVLVAGFSALAAALFWLLFRRLKRFHSQLWVLALLSVGICLAGVAIWVLGLFLIKNTYPQVTLVAIGILLSTGLSWFYTRRGLELGIFSIPEKSKEDLTSYVVFISYARTPENAKWVKENVYDRLCSEFKKHEIFFDTKSIKLADDWQSKLARGITDSRFFLPIYTKDYFDPDRKYCIYEREKAYMRHMKLGDFIIPIAREAVGDLPIPFDYHKIQAIEIKERLDFMDEVLAKIKEGLQEPVEGQAGPSGMPGGG